MLTADELRFEQLVPRRESLIPLADVAAVETKRWWLGKSVGSKLLCVRWRSPDGSEDAMAWAVRDLDAWLAAIAAERDRAGVFRPRGFPDQTSGRGAPLRWGKAGERRPRGQT